MVRRSATLVIAATFGILAGNIEARAAGAVAERSVDAGTRERIEATFATMDRLVRDRIDELGIPGAAFGVVIDGQLVFTGTAGFRDLERNLPVEKDSIFRIASMTKSFTALAVLLLRDDGKLSLDDPVARFVPELRTLPLPSTDSAPITIRQLLTHQSGFPEDNPWADRQMEISEDEFSDRLTAGIPFSTAPGSQYQYSNLGFAILGRVIANVSGQTYGEFLQEHILGPLGMSSTYLDIDAVPAARLATGYAKGPGHAAFAPDVPGADYTSQQPLDDGAFAPIGGMFTDAADIAKWITVMLSAFPASDDAAPSGIAAHSLREMQSGQGSPRLSVRRRYAAGPIEAKASTYGFGLRITQSCEFGRMVDHSGGFPGFGSNMQWLPDYGVGVFVLANRTYASASRIAQELLKIMYDSGGLVPRPPKVSAVLRRSAADVFRLVDEWDDAIARRIVADNFRQDRPLDLRRSDIADLRNGLGKCEMGDIEAENALRGEFRMHCEGGWLDVSLTLAPTSPPLVQYLRVTRGSDPSPAMDKLIDDVLDGMRNTELPAGTSTDLDHSTIGALLWAIRSNYGNCTRKPVLGGDGVTKSQVELSCDSGGLQLTVAAAGDRLTGVDLVPLKGQTCAL